jgi:hypothetical protein
MSTEKLSALEARLTAAKDDGDGAETTKPIGNNAARPTGPKNYEDMTSAELKAAMKSLSPAEMGLSR